MSTRIPRWGCTACFMCTYVSVLSVLHAKLRLQASVFVWLTFMHELCVLHVCMHATPRMTVALLTYMWPPH